MYQPQGFVDNQHPDFICRLLKSLYGLKQVPRAWFERFMAHLSSLGFRASLADPILFVWKFEKFFIILLLYVDDIIIIGNNQSTMHILIRKLARAFAMKVSAHYTVFWALRFVPQKIVCFLHKQSMPLIYCKSKTDGAKPYSFQVLSGSNLSILDGDPLLDPTEYRNAVGALQ